MFGIPGEAIKNLSHGDIQKYKQFSTVWCWGYKRDIIQKYNIQFHENLILYEDGIFNCEYLIHCNKISSISEIGYVYYFRPNGATARLSYSYAMIDNKINLVEARATIRNIIQKKQGIDIGSWAYGSCILSVFQIYSAAVGIEGGFEYLKNYIYMSEVQEAIKSVRIRGNFKFKIAFLIA